MRQVAGGKRLSPAPESQAEQESGPADDSPSLFEDPIPKRRNLTHGVLSERYHRRGLVASDTPAVAAARQQQTSIQRDHRHQRRDGVVPSLTPGLSTLVDRAAANAPSSGPQTPDREMAVDEGGFSFEGNNTDAASSESSLQLHPQPRGRGRPRVRPLPDPTLPRRGRGRPRLLRSDQAGSRRGRPRLPRRPVGRPIRVEPAADFDVPPPAFSGNTQESPLSASDLAIKKEFDSELAKEEMRFCSRCKERWFDIQLQEDQVCKRCHLKDDKKRIDEPFFYSAENHLDFGVVPQHLPALEPAEEMLIARVHVSVNVFTVLLLYLVFCLSFAANSSSRFVASSTNTAATLFISSVTLARCTMSSHSSLRTSISLSSARKKPPKILP